LQRSLSAGGPPVVELAG